MKLKSEFVTQDIGGTLFVIPVGAEQFKGIVRSNPAALTKLPVPDYFLLLLPVSDYFLLLHLTGPVPLAGILWRFQSQRITI